MAFKCVAVKSENGHFSPATEFDEETFREIPKYKPVRLNITTMSDRSYQHHKLFFGGLLPFAFQYWKGTGTQGAITESENAILNSYVKYIEKIAGTEQPVLWKAKEELLSRISAKRQERYGEPSRSIESFREWLMIQIGHCELVETPSGSRLVAKSIDFSRCSQEEFSAIYKRCFDVCWSIILSHQFESEEQASRAIEEFMWMGS